MLPEGDMQSPRVGPLRYGAFAMESRSADCSGPASARSPRGQGVQRRRGAVRHMQQMNIGGRNGRIRISYLRTEGISVKAQDLGGDACAPLSTSRAMARGGPEMAPRTTSAPEGSSPSANSTAEACRPDPQPAAGRALPGG